MQCQCNLKAMKKFAALISALLLPFAMVAHDNMTPGQFKKLIETPGVQIVDVRTAAEYIDGHIKGAILIDIKDSLFRAAAAEKLSKDFPVALYCKTGRRSLKAYNILEDEGYRVYNLESGLAGWLREGFQLVKEDIITK